MFLCIESWKGDCLLCGKRRSEGELLDQIRCVETLYNRNEDNFVPLLCRMYGWERTESDTIPDYTYDRDTGILF